MVVNRSFFPNFWRRYYGKETYTVWVEMLRRLVPDGRTHRLAPLVGSMLQYASTVAYEKYGASPEEGSVAHSLLLASEADDPEEIEELLAEVVEQLFSDAKVKFQRTSSRGDEYSLIESAFYEFIHWYDMPWEV